MIVFDVQCSDGHRFEGWFRSGADFDRQAAGGAIACPICDDTRVTKAPMAPRVACGSTHDEARAAASGGCGEAETRRLFEALTQLRRHVEDTCDYVGREFPEEARRIHYGETEHRDIYGETTREEARDLAGEGIAVRQIPWLPPRNG